MNAPQVDICIDDDGARVDVTENTEGGASFIDGWIGAIVEVIDSGHIVIPHEALEEFARAADQQSLTIATLNRD